jgi:hypothetical protein
MGAITASPSGTASVPREGIVLHIDDNEDVIVSWLDLALPWHCDASPVWP